MNPRVALQVITRAKLFLADRAFEPLDSEVDFNVLLQICALREILPAIGVRALVRTVASVYSGMIFVVTPLGKNFAAPETLKIYAESIGFWVPNFYLSAGFLVVNCVPPSLAFGQSNLADLENRLNFTSGRFICFGWKFSELRAVATPTR